MEEGLQRTIVWDSNTEPPKNYIWVRSDGYAYEYDYKTRQWVKCSIMGGSGITCLFRTVAEWEATPNYVPGLGELAIHTDYKHIDDGNGNIINVPGLKIGDGVTPISQLMYVSGIGSDSSYDFEDHIRNRIIHITNDERIKWNNKVSIDLSEIDDEVLIFTKD